MDKSENQDPDPNKIGSDPQHCVVEEKWNCVVCSVWQQWRFPAWRKFSRAAGRSTIFQICKPVSRLLLLPLQIL